MEKIFKANDESLSEVTEFIMDNLSICNLSMKDSMQLELVIEEVFINIAHYAYPPKEGNVKIIVAVDPNFRIYHITFIDTGVEFDPLKREDPDISLSAAERKIGGLGIFLAKKIMDNLEYHYLDKQNILKISKKY